MLSSAYCMLLLLSLLLLVSLVSHCYYPNHIYPHFRACFFFKVSFRFYIYGKYEREKQTEGTDGYYQIRLIYICLFFGC